MLVLFNVVFRAKLLEGKLCSNDVYLSANLGCAPYQDFFNFSPGFNMKRRRNGVLNSNLVAGIYSRVPCFEFERSRFSMNLVMAIVILLDIIANTLKMYMLRASVPCIVCPINS